MQDVISASKKIIVAPLNWGLGHATRSMVIIDQLLRAKKEVIIASDGIALTLLKKEYPQLETWALPSYNINYKGKSFLWSMLLQSPKVLKAIQDENQFLKKKIIDSEVDLIISDNRYGIYHRDIESIMLTHQLSPFFPSKIQRKTATTIITKLLSPFDKIWVPDNTQQSLSGTLSESKEKNNIHYIGALSRLQLVADKIKDIDVLAIISGPEPSRSNFELKLIKFLESLPGKHVIIRGTDQERNDKSAKIEMIDLADKKQIETYINRAKVLLTRSGYSTIMDLAEARQKKYIVPTPGQTEQEYLAEYLDGKMGFIALSENDLAKINL